MAHGSGTRSALSPRGAATNYVARGLMAIAEVPARSRPRGQGEDDEVGRRPFYEHP